MRDVHAKFPSLSVFFPAYNDAPSLPGLLRKTFETLERHVEDYEVIVVNDGSRDNTAEVLDELRRHYAPALRVITHPENRGYGGALRSGFAAATQGVRLLHRWRRAVRRRRTAAAARAVRTRERAW